MQRSTRSRQWLVPQLLVLVLLVLALLAPGVGAADARAPAAAGPQIAAGTIETAGHGRLCLDNTQGQHPGTSNHLALAVRRCGGPHVATWNQLWTVEADHTIRLDGLCLAAAAPSRPAQLRSCSAQRAASWVITGSQIRSGNRGYCLATRGRPRPGAAVVLRHCDPRSATQRWITPTFSPQSRALSVLGPLLDSYNLAGHSTGLFTTRADPGTKSCSTTGRKSNCWWWSAVALYALADFAEQNPSSRLAVATIEAEIRSTYRAICGAPTTCPAGPDAHGADKFGSLRNFANRFFDDTDWWALTWLNAWQLTGNKRYIFLAEQLWNYLSTAGWDKACGGALKQYSGLGRHGMPTEDVITNALYLRLSAWLYVVTSRRGSPRARQYMTGVAGSGGAIPVARWIAGTADRSGNAAAAPSKLISGPFSNVTAPSEPPIAVGSAGSRFSFADHLDGQCGQSGLQMGLNTQGAAVAAFTDMYSAERVYQDIRDARYYLRIADNLADTIMANVARPVQPPHAVLGIYRIPSGPALGPPTVSSGGILAEPCDPAPDRQARRPAGCTLARTVRTAGHVSHDEPAFLPNKGIFMRSLYCLARTLGPAGMKDAAIAPFIAANAASVWGNDQATETSRPAAADLNQFGFLWGPGGFRASRSVLNFATQGSALEALGARAGGSAAMC